MWGQWILGMQRWNVWVKQTEEMFVQVRADRQHGRRSWSWGEEGVWRRATDAHRASGSRGRHRQEDGCTRRGCHRCLVRRWGSVSFLPIPIPQKIQIFTDTNTNTVYFSPTNTDTDPHLMFSLEVLLFGELPSRWRDNASRSAQNTGHELLQWRGMKINIKYLNA